MLQKVKRFIRDIGAVHDERVRSLHDPEVAHPGNLRALDADLPVGRAGEDPPRQRLEAAIAGNDTDLELHRTESIRRAARARADLARRRPEHGMVDGISGEEVRQLASLVRRAEHHDASQPLRPPAAVREHRADDDAAQGVGDEVDPPRALNGTDDDPQLQKTAIYDINATLTKTISIVDGTQTTELPRTEVAMTGPDRSVTFPAVRPGPRAGNLLEVPR